MKYVNKQLNDLDKMKNQFLLRMCFLHTCCVFMMCGLFYSSIVCLYVYAYDFKSKVHCGNALGPGTSGLPYYCAPLICVPTGGKMAEMSTRFGQGLCGQRHGLAMNWVDRPRTSADERDVVCSPRCSDFMWAVQGLVVFFH